MKLNNKGFALTSIIYMLIVLFLMVMLLILANLAQRKVVLDKIKNEVKENLNQGGLLATNSMIVTFDPQGGQLNQTTKQVEYHQPYGELPTPTKEGYVFMGWRGKNMLNSNIISGYYDDGLGNLAGNTNIYKSTEITNYLTQGNYTISSENGITLVRIYNKTEQKNTMFSINLPYSFELINDSQIGFSFREVESNTKIWSLGDNTIVARIQLEEGTTATTYEPYQEYTSDTIVTKKENHTLYAIWKKEYTITNLVQNGSFENGFDNWERTAYTDNTLDYHSINSDYKKDGSNSMARIANSTAGRYYITQYHIPFISGHKYYFFAYGYTNSNTSQQINGDVANRSNSSIVASFVNSDGWKKISRIYTPENTEERQISINYGTTTDTTYVDGIGIIDLTEAFGAGSEPAKAWCDDNIEYFDGSTTILY